MLLHADTIAPASHQPIEAARAMFRRYLAAWAMDMLELRRRGLNRPGARRDPSPRPGALPRARTV